MTEPAAAKSMTLRLIPHAEPADGEASANVLWLRQATQLARSLADAMLLNVQKTTAMNFDAARMLLAHARLPMPVDAERSNESWRMAWRSYEVCATSCEQMLNLARTHTTRSQAEVWRGVSRMIDEMASIDGDRVQAARSAFETLAQLQELYWQAARDVHREVAALVHAAQAGGRDGAH
jgi:hypothetical protein